MTRCRPLRLDSAAIWVLLSRRAREYKDVMVKGETFTMTLKSVFHVKQTSVLRFCQQHRAVGFKGQAEHTVAAEE